MKNYSRMPRIIFSMLGLVLLGSAQTAIPERDVVLARMSAQWGTPHAEDNEISFEGTGYQLQAIFDEHGVLAAIKGSSRRRNLKQKTYQQLLAALGTVKPLGNVQKTDSRWYWGMNTMTKRIDRYEHAVSDRCELGNGRSRGTGWFRVLYPHMVTGEVSSIERPHGEVRTPCEGPDRKEATCVDFETPDWDLAEIRIGDEDFLFKNADYPDLKKGDHASISVMGPLDHVCGSL